MMASATVDVRIADLEPFRAFMGGVGTAAKMFGRIGDEELASLPEAFRDGITALQGAVEAWPAATGNPAAQEADGDERPLYGPVIIEWPAPVRPGVPLAGWGCAIFDAGSGKMITTVSQVFIPAVRAVPERWIECELTMFADEDGEPVLELEPGPRKGTSGMSAVLDDDGNIRTGTFRFLVAGMRVAQK